jgi:hypothetical protein
MDDARELPPQWVPALWRARCALDVADEVGLALRAHRRRLGLSQRGYASLRGLSRAMVARLEAGAGRMSLDTVVEAWEGTGFCLQLALADDDDPAPDSEAAAVVTEEVVHRLSGAMRRPVPPESWEPTDLVARVRGGSRRFPAHRTVEPVTNPPMWWWMHEFFAGPSEEPKWYAPVCHLDRPSAVARTDEGAPGAA